MRIISVVPSLTELLIDLDLTDQIVGITRFCIHPKKIVADIPKIGGTKSLHVDRIISLKPDLIIANKEENSQTDIEILQQHFKVLLTEIYSLKDAISAIKEIGILTNRKKESRIIANQINNEFQNLKAIPAGLHKVAYVIWNNPIMMAGRNTFINAMLKESKWNNILEKQDSRYPEITPNELKKLNPDIILLSSEPFPFKETHVADFKSNYPESKVILVDGEMFSWYGSRLKLAPSYFQKLRLEVDS